MPSRKVQNRQVKIYIHCTKESKPVGRAWNQVEFMGKTRNRAQEILALFPTPFYTTSKIYFEGDLEEMGTDQILHGLSESVQDQILAHATTLARIKPELAFNFLNISKQLLELIPISDLEKWSRVVLDIFDTGGLHPARDFILGLNTHGEFERHWGGGVAFHEYEAVLSHYVHGLGGEGIVLKEGPVHYTDLESIFLPSRIALFPKSKKNIILYKTMVTHKFGQIKMGTYRLDWSRVSPLIQSLGHRYGESKGRENEANLERFFDFFPEPTLMSDLFNLLETIRIEGWFRRELPGLYGQMKGLKLDLAHKRGLAPSVAPISKIMEALNLDWLKGAPLGKEKEIPSEISGLWIQTIRRLGQEGANVYTTAALGADLYGLLQKFSGPYQSPGSIPYVGVLRPGEAERGRKRRRESLKVRFRREWAKLIQDLPEFDSRLIKKHTDKVREAKSSEAGHRPSIPDHFEVKGRRLSLPPTLKSMVREIYEDLGAIPSDYLTVTDEMSGHYFHSLCQMPEGTGYVLPMQGEGIFLLDEWDFRRQGHRKHWAVLRERDSPSGGMDFVDKTLSRYGGTVRRIKGQFEKMKTEQALLRRQKEGEAG